MKAPTAHMTIEQRARFALEHQDVAHTPADLREIIDGLLNGQLRKPPVSDYPRVRYCYECGRVGEVPPGFRDCCPDGNHATYVHPEVAQQARLGFQSLIKQEKSKEAGEHPEEGTHL